MKRLFFYAMTMAAALMMPQTSKAITFDKSTRYSALVINSRINDFYANTFHIGMGEFDDAGNKVKAEAGAKANLDYVPGLVAKAVLEAVDYYKDNADVDVKPWFYAVQNYGVVYDITANGKNGKSFDDLNGVKIYSKLQDICKAGVFPDGAINTNAATLTVCNNRFRDALAGIKAANTTYSIKASTNQKAAGGWWHKASYDNQMWCDGQYMGPALLAQMINDYSGYAEISSTGTDWDLITKQFDIAWNYLWNPDTQLLYHAFSATPKASTSSCWATLPCPYDNTACTNTAYWGRADAWYMFALVDVLEQMDKAGITADDTNYADLRQKLNTLAKGIAARQDEKSGCWYQLLDKDDTYSSYGTKNYLEASASSIFTASFLKGMRLHYFDEDYTAMAKKGYQGIVEQFMADDGKGGVQLFGTCKSAGLGGSAKRKGDYNYYLNGSDVGVANEYTEGKTLGAFILAAVEYERQFSGNPTSSSSVDASSITVKDSKKYNLVGMEIPTPKKDEIYIAGGKKFAN